MRHPWSSPRRPRLGRLIGLALLSAACAAPQPQARPDRFAGIAPEMQRFVDRGEISGIVTLVASKDSVRHLAAVGRSDLERDRKMETDDIFWIASMSKPITSLAIAMLKDDGELSFDDPLSKYIPAFADVQVARDGALTRPIREITLRDILTHTSGLGEMTERAPHLTLEQTAALAAKQPLRFDPGTRWQYSTLGMDLLGRVVEVASGIPFDRFLQTRLFQPLGMENTTFWPTPDQAERFAQNYQIDPATKKLVPVEIPYLYHTALTDRQRPPLGGAGLFSTAEDIVRVYQMMLNHGTFRGLRILQPATVAEMTRVQTGDLKARPGMPWGLGFCIVTDPTAMEANRTTAPGTFGHGGAHGTSSWAEPASGLVYVMMLQRANMGNPDNSPMQIAFRAAAAKGVEGVR